MKPKAMIWTLFLGGAAALLLLCSGCSMFGSNKKVDTLLAASETQSKRMGITEAVLYKLAERDKTVVGDTLANMESGGAAAYLEIERCIRDENLKPLLTKDGVAQFEKLTAIAKSRSGREFSNLLKGSLTMIGLPRDKDGGPVMNALPDVMRLDVEEAPAGGGSTANTEWAKVWGDAAAAEKSTILAGLAELATRRGDAFAVRITAMNKGLTDVITSAGTLTGLIVKAAVVPVPADLAEAGVTKLVQAVLKQLDGTKTTILAADTPESATATAAEGAVVAQ